jgi:hypothetical protein
LVEDIERVRDAARKAGAERMRQTSRPCDDTELNLGAIELAVVVPTFNEIENIALLVDAIQAALVGHAFEIIVVDDNSWSSGECRLRASRSTGRVQCGVIRIIVDAGPGSAQDAAPPAAPMADATPRELAGPPST